MKSLIKIGTRGSKLALYQAELIQSKLAKAFPHLKFEFVRIKTKGDLDLSVKIGELGPGIFTREIESALLENQIDLAVHSAKDLATNLPAGLEIGATPEREDPRDCFVGRNGKTFDQLKKGSRVGTSSLRRKALLRKMRGDLEIKDIRGNVDTRIRKIEEGAYDGMVIAHAGLKRLGLASHVTQIFDESLFPPQAGQGALAIEIRTGDRETKEFVGTLNHEPTYTRVLAERSFLRRLEGGCQVPAGVASKIEKDTITLRGAILSVDGKKEVADMCTGPVSGAEELGASLAGKLLKNGGEDILRAIRNGVR